METYQRLNAESDIPIPIIAGLTVAGIAAVSAVGGILGYATGLGASKVAAAAATIATGWVFREVAKSFPHWMDYITPEATQLRQEARRAAGELAQRVVRGGARVRQLVEQEVARVAGGVANAVRAARRRVLPEAPPAA